MKPGAIAVENCGHGIASAQVNMLREAKLRRQRLFPCAPRATLNGFAPVSKLWPRCGHVRDPSARVQAPMRPTVPPQSTPWRFKFTLSQTRTISAKRAGVHQNLSRRPSPPRTATRRWPVACRRGHHGVQTRGVGAADHGIKDERHARLRALSRSVGTADGVPGHGSVSVACQLCCQSRRELARSAHQPHTAGCLQLHSQTTGSDHHADRRTQHGPRRAPRAA
jgi:hypothetical protein